MTATVPRYEAIFNPSDGLFGGLDLGQHHGMFLKSAAQRGFVTVSLEVDRLVVVTYSRRIE
jgi:hypothetical protein